MPVVQNSTAITANATTENVLTGSQFEIMPRPSVIELGFTQSATGILIDVFVGKELVLESFQPSLQNRLPVYPDDFTSMGEAVPMGSRVKIRARNTTGGTLTLFYSMRITEVG